ncbi:MAG: hypothetical protein E6Q58_05040 [Niabella sp.]|nr:MAG: hypothetical protein E6Q58_05040 [Niabella sp.]
MKYLFGLTMLILSLCTPIRVYAGDQSQISFFLDGESFTKPPRYASVTTTDGKYYRNVRLSTSKDGAAWVITVTWPGSQPPAEIFVSRGARYCDVTFSNSTAGYTAQCGNEGG